MLTRSLAAAAVVTATSIAGAQGSATVDLLNPAETSGTIPTNTRIVDMYFDCANTDLWTAAGIRAIADRGASIIYFDSDANISGTQPGLFSGGTANKFTTMLSRPRGRDSARRFTESAAAAAGGYDPPGASPVTTGVELNVAYFASPPETHPSIDGYIARIAVDISNVAPIPGADIQDYANWAAGPLSAVPAGATVVLRSVGLDQPGGTATATFDFPQLEFSNWAMWYVPEPAALPLLAIGVRGAFRRRCG